MRSELSEAALGRSYKAGVGSASESGFGDSFRQRTKVRGGVEGAAWHLECPLPHYPRSGQAVGTQWSPSADTLGRKGLGGCIPARLTPPSPSFLLQAKGGARAAQGLRGPAGHGCAPTFWDWGLEG